MKTTLITLTALAALASFSSAQDKTKKGVEQAYNPAEIIKRFDKNSDSKLSLEEFSAMKKWAKETDPKAAAKTAFEAIDTNKDGSLTAEELKAAHEAKAKEKDKAKVDEKAPATKPATTEAKAVEVKPAEKK